MGNPAETMKKELNGWSELALELGYDPSDGKSEEGGIGEKIHSFQEWLSGVPGIDEATALSSAIEHIESGRYDMIVFDTAPTGHTLKLLELPKILQAGLDKLESWQATLWGYWEMIRGFTSGAADSSGVKVKVAEKLKAYKASIGRVSGMITDKARTRFVVVCIAEYLSISESRRLLSELDRFEVLVSHIVVNQLVTQSLEDSELAELERLVEKDSSPVLEKALAASRLTTARRNIQSKYLKDLKGCPEVNRLPDPEQPELRTNRKAGTEPMKVLEVPLLPSEVTGPKAILSFSNFLVGKDLGGNSKKSIGIESERSKQARKKDEEDARLEAEAAKKTVGKEKPKVGKGSPLSAMAGGIVDDLMKDPEMAKMLEENPKLVKIVEEVKANPMAGMKYMSDPEVSPFISKAMGKLMQKGGGNKQAGGDKAQKEEAKEEQRLGFMNCMFELSADERASSSWADGVRRSFEGILRDVFDNNCKKPR